MLAADAHGARLIQAAISDDGRYVAFTQNTNVAVADTVGGDVKLLDRALGDISDISGDGSKVPYSAAFGSKIFDLTTGVTEVEGGFGPQLDYDGSTYTYLNTVPGGGNQVFVHDPDQRLPELVSRTTTGDTGNSDTPPALNR